MFAVVWLWLFRDEIRFPRSLAVIPAGVVVLFLLNAVRIAALILIGHGGAPDIAIGGFHSQAGWIAFCSVAFGLTVAAPRVPWLALRPLEQEIVNPVAPYLVPFLTILATGFLSRAVSADFEWLYPMRFFSALVALWLFRRSYSKMDWKFGWFALVVGTAVFLMWIAMDRFTPGAGRMPSALAGAPAWAKGSWIACRIAAAVITVPIAEELAFRGFLLRRLNSADFESVSFRSFTWFSLLASSILFGILHGQRWVAGSAAGVLFGLAARQKGRLGDAVAAHAVTNVLLGVYVLVFQEWYLW
jgi:exosortase E/protease (VPEID-CTERM system)